MKRPFYVAGYPKSGTTWLTRLLGDALGCPTGASLPRDDAEEPAAEGKERPGPFVVRKGHFLLTDREGGPFVPSAHRMTWRNWNGEPIVFIVRDPRDVAVSLLFYRRRGLLKDVVEDMAGGAFRLEPWQDYAASWLDAPLPRALVRYEDLLADGEGEITRVLIELGVKVPAGRLARAVERQSFAARKAWIREHGDRLPRGRAWNLRFMRRGVAGDWRNHFTGELAREAERHFGPVMRRLGYTEDADWWKTL